MVLQKIYKLPEVFPGVDLHKMPGESFGLE
jgi:hypothetical protein